MRRYLNEVPNWSLAKQRAREEEEARLKAEAQAREEERQRKIAELTAKNAHKANKPRVRFSKDLWKKLMDKAKEIGREERKKNKAGGIIAMMKRGVEKRKKEEEAAAMRAGEEAREAAVAAAQAQNEEERMYALERKKAAEEEEARAKALVAELEAQLAEAEKKMSEDTSKEDEFEDSVFEEKQRRAIMRAEIAKAEKKRLRKLRKKEKGEDGGIVQKASCEYRTSETGIYRKRTMSMEQETRMNAALQKALHDRQTFGYSIDTHLEGRRSSVCSVASSTGTVDEVAKLKEEMIRQQKARMEEKAKAEREKKDREKNMAAMQAKLEEEKARALKLAEEKRRTEEDSKNFAERNKRRLEEAGNAAAQLAMNEAQLARDKQRSTMMAAQDEAVRKAREADRAAGRESLADDFISVGITQQQQSFGSSNVLETSPSLKDGDTSLQLENDFMIDPAETLYKIRAASTLQELSQIQELSNDRSNIQFVDVREEREKEKQLAESEDNPNKPVRTPAQLSPRKRGRDEPPSPTKQNLMSLKVQRGDSVKEERQLSKGNLDRINREFVESDKLREEASVRMSNFTSTLQSAKQFVGGARRSRSMSEGGTALLGEVHPAWKNRWYTPSAFVPPNHLSGENTQITSLQYKQAKTETTLSNMAHRTQSMRYQHNRFKDF